MYLHRLNEQRIIEKSLSYTHFSKIMIENRNISTNTSFDVDNNLSNPYQFQKEERQNN